ncbi:L-rhamnose-binding lectin SML-like [Dunckerocampus dactyliophorus]|uniref:L-rhamnose-binding lectin SML-like n=1 Tax=Dunckerocampus dactyliophorus TaxID=161453 RepID=UPI002406A288|nr:L-rhamnose-binding lectin SML-like [Dunckerocampus dactyliophorus]XP_054648864.1 L-rhamnose-binding lectin SML-like [Dunckerocampus dactyliophorus]
MMPCLRVSATLMLIATCFLLKEVVCAERATTCESGANVHLLNCGSGVISVQEGLYGRTNPEICKEGRPPQQLANTQCSQAGAVDVLKTRCNGKKSCELNINVFRTPDPCVGTFKYLETNFTCLPAISVLACEDSLAHLFCDVGQVIFVYGADYGRRDRTTCTYKRPPTQVQNAECSRPSTLVANSCNGKNSCTIRASNAVFGDPCVGTYKYLEVAYTCEYPGV